SANPALRFPEPPWSHASRAREALFVESAASRLIPFLLRPRTCLGSLLPIRFAVGPAPRSVASVAVAVPLQVAHRVRSLVFPTSSRPTAPAVRLRGFLITSTFQVTCQIRYLPKRQPTWLAAHANSTRQYALP